MLWETFLHTSKTRNSKHKQNLCQIFFWNLNTSTVKWQELNAVHKTTTVEVTLVYWKHQYIWNNGTQKLVETEHEQTDGSDMARQIT